VSASTKIFDVQTAAFDDAFERADGDGFVAVCGHDNLASIGMTPFLVTALLG
jgi:hypothetical protein